MSGGVWVDWGNLGILFCLLSSHKSIPKGPEQGVYFRKSLCGCVSEPDVPAVMLLNRFGSTGGDRQKQRKAEDENAHL